MMVIRAGLMIALGFLLEAVFVNLGFGLVGAWLGASQLAERFAAIAYGAALYLVWLRPAPVFDELVALLLLASLAAGAAVAIS